MDTPLLIDTGGTFNKYYDPVNGELVVDGSSKALRDMLRRWHTDAEILSIIGKDSLEMTSQDRLELMMHINQTPHERIVVVHGTDTMHVTAEYLAESELDKRIVLTGAMVPYSIDPVEATANFASAFTFAICGKTHGVFVAMHGMVLPWEELVKDKEAGRFVRQIN